MSISSLFQPNDYNTYCNTITTTDIEPYTIGGGNGVLNIGTGTVTATGVSQINIGVGGAHPTPVFIDGVLYNPNAFLTSIGPISSVSNPDGCIDTAGEFQLCVADGTNGGVLSNSSQTIAGLKTFANGISSTMNTGIFGLSPSAPQMCTVNSSGSLGSQAIPASGVNSLVAFGSTPNANGALISGTTLALEPCDGTHPGGIALAAQTMGSGLKTFVNGIQLAASQKVQTSTGTTLLWTGQGSQSGVFLGNQSGSVAPGINNIGIGTSALTSLNGGANNVCIGPNVGAAYTGGESANILIGNVGGNVGESGMIRIGVTGTQTACQIAGIYGNAPTTPQMVISDVNGNLGTQAIPGGVTSMVAFGSTPNANGAVISGTTLALEPCSGSFPGGVALGAQTMGTGTKTFTNDITGQANLNLPQTTGSTVGVANLGLIRAHGFGDVSTGTNTHMGTQSGNFTNSGTTNTCYGYQTGLAMTAASGNTFVGSGAGRSCQTAANCVVLGNLAGSALTTGSSNTFVGSQAGSAMISGVNGVFVGLNAGSTCTTSNNSTVVGGQSDCGNNANSTIVGAFNIVTGGTNIVLGEGNTAAVSGSNILIGNNVGVAADSGQTRIGTVGTQTKCQIAGIFGNSPTTPSMVISDANGNLGTQAIPSGGGVTTMAAVGTSPNANGATISGTTLTLQPCNGSQPGIITINGQTLAGTKIFAGGLQLGNGVALYNTAMGTLIWNGVNNDTQSVYIGSGSGAVVTTGTRQNTGCGQGSLAKVTTGINNTGYGYNTFTNLLTGNINTAIGSTAGSAYTGAESNNVLLAHPGVIGDSAVIRLGTATQTTAFCDTLKSTTTMVASTVTNQVTCNSSTGQLQASQNYVAAGLVATPTLNAGTILTMSTRGSANAAPFPLTSDIYLIGVLCTMRVPQFTIATMSGGPAGSVILGTLAAGFRPATSVSQSVNIVTISVVSSLAADFVITPAGVCSLNFDGGTYAVPFGIGNDLLITWFAAI